jgi:predicted ArsR family transcriptional regulator
MTTASTPPDLCPTCHRPMPVKARMGRPPVKQDAVLAHLREHGPKTRAELVHDLGLTESTVRAALKALHAQGALHVVGQALGGQGRPTDKWGVEKPPEDS